MRQAYRSSMAALWLATLAGCAAPTEPLPSCGPARSLAPELVQSLPPRTGEWQPDEDWAKLAEQHPGGFAGVFYEQGQPVLMLSRPQESAAAKAALAGAMPYFPVASAEVRSARWDFSQLYDWYVYLIDQPTLFDQTFVSGDKNEVRNRIVFGVTDSAAIRRAQLELARLDVPCDLVVLRIESPTVLD